MKQFKLILLFLLIAANSYAQLSETFDSAPSVTTPAASKSTTWSLQNGNWTIINKTGQTVSWNKNSGATATLTHNGPGAAYLQKENVSATDPLPEDWLITPLINIAGTTNPKLNFYSRLTYVGDQGGIYKVLISTTLPSPDPLTGIINTSTFSPLQTWTELEINPVQTEYRKVTVTLPTNIGNTFYIAFVMIGDDRDRWLIDDVSVGSSCPEPVNPVVTDITTTSAKLTWDNTGASQWEVEVMPYTAVPAGTGTIVSQNYYSTGNTLTLGTQYKFYIRVLCPPGGASNPSDWVGPILFSTALPGKSCSAPIVIPATLPYIKTKQDFMAHDGYSNPGSACGTGSGAYVKPHYTVYSYTSVYNAIIDVIVNPTRNETGVFIYDNCADIGVECLAGAASLTPMEKSIQNFSATGGVTYYIVVSSITDDPYSLIVNADCATPPVASFNVYSDCGDASYFATAANVTSMGGASSILASLYVDGNLFESTVCVAPGLVTFSPMPPDKQAKILLQNQQNPNCILLSKTLSKLLCPPANDECAGATILTPGTSGFTPSKKGTLNGATASPQASNCPGNEDDDVWYSFIANADKQLIQITSIAGNDLNLSHTLYQGTCGNLTQLYCDNDGHSIASNLVPGLPYTVRVYSTGSIDAETSFNISTTGFPFTCMDDNLQSETVKGLFKDLLNYLRTVQIPVSNPFTCAELTALAPYITDPNPKIYNFTKMDQDKGMAFSFSNHNGDYDVWINWEENQEISDINFYSYLGADVPENMHVIFTSGAISNVRNLVKHIDFCPVNPPCPENSGSIDINPGNTCIVAGAQTGFSFITEDTNIASYLWVFYKNEQAIATSQLASPVMTFADEIGNYSVKLTVTSTGGCKTVFRKIFIVSADCSSNGCAETNPYSDHVKTLYIKLINKLFDVYGTGNTSLPTTYASSEVVELLKYTSAYGNEVIYNVHYDLTNNILKFAILPNNDPAYYDVKVANYGHIVDISLHNFAAPSLFLSGVDTMYANGYIEDSNVIKDIQFCPPCIYRPLEIVLNPGVSCAKTNTPVKFKLETVNSSQPVFYYWSAYDQNGNEIAYEWHDQNTDGNIGEITDLEVTFPSPGIYIISAAVQLEGGCNYGEVNKTIIVQDECKSCTETDFEAEKIKKRYLNLVNYLSSTYPPGAVIPNPIICPELDALGPYVTDENPKIWNLHYDGPDLKFSFSNHGNDYDVSFTGQQYVADINLFTYSSPTNLEMYQGYDISNPYVTTSKHTIRHINFCAGGGSETSDPCPQIAGIIGLGSGESCVPLNVATEFHLDANTVNIKEYKWMFYDSSGVSYVTKADAKPNYTYNTEGNYFIKLVTTDNIGCESEFYKYITVSSDCSQFCTETNPDSAYVKELYIELLNYLISLDTIPEGFTCPKLANLAPYIADSNPTITNVQYSNNGKVLTFDFNGGAHFMIERLGTTIVDINLVNYYTPFNNDTYVMTFSNGKQSFLHNGNHINFCPDPLPCESHIAFVIDESSSMKEEEVANIKKQLTYFINQQYEQHTGNTISFTGMSDSDENTRTDHVMSKVITEADKQTFLNWIASYRSGYTTAEIGMGISPNSDYWASGLKYIMDKSLTPDVVIVITDGSQTNDVNGLKQIVQRVNSDSKLFVYGADEGFYVDGDSSFDQTIYNSTMELYNPWPSLTGHPWLAPGLILYDKSKAHTGKYSIKLTTPTWANPQVSYVQTTATININNAEDTMYAYSGWIYAAQNPGQLTFFTYTPGVAGYSAYQSTASTVIGSWQYVEGTFNVPKEARGLSLRIDNLGVGDVWFDDLKIEKILNVVNRETVFSSTLETLGDWPTRASYPNTLDYVSYDASTSYTGNASLKINHPGGYSEVYNYSNKWIDIDNQQATEYTFSAWVRSEQASAEMFLLTTNDESGNNTPATHVAHATSAIQPGWQYIQQTYIVPVAAKKLNLRLDNNGPGDVWFDDVKIVKKGTASPLTYDQVVYDNNLETSTGFPSTASYPGGAPIVFDTTKSHSGDVSLKVSNVATAETYVHADTWVAINNTVPTVYTYSGWVNTETHYEIVLFMRTATETNYFTDVTSIGESGSTSGWKYVEGTFTVPENITMLNIRLDTDAIGSAWFDDIKITRKATASASNSTDTQSLVTGKLMTSLKFLMDLPQSQFPVQSFTDFENAVYYADTDHFVNLKEEEFYFSNNLIDAKIGCDGQHVSKDFCDDCETFQPSPGQVYWLSAWVKEEQNIQVKTYENARINLVFEDSDEYVFETMNFLPTGEIIDGWQRIATKFTIPAETSVMKVELENLSQGIPVYFDDIRVHPISGSMKSFVYDPVTFRLMAELDDNNYSTFYEYDNEGGLIRIKKETSKGVKTIQESRSGTVINPSN